MNGSIAWYLGILATALGRWDEAEAHFAAVLRQNTQMGATPMILQTKQRYAEMLLARKYPGDQEKALRLLDEALAMVKASGMGLTLQSILGLREPTLHTLQAQKATARAKLKLV